LVSHCAGNADATRDANGLQAGCYVHPIAEDVTVINDEITDVKPHAKNDPFVLGDIRIAVEHCPLQLNRADSRLDSTGELSKDAVAGGFHDAPTMPLHRRFQEFAPDDLQARMRPGFVPAHKPGVTNNINRQDSG